MKNSHKLAFKLFGRIIFIVFVLYFISFFLNFQGYVVPALEDYRKWFEKIIDLLFSNLYFHLCFGVGFIALFIWGSFDSNKKMGWDELASRYSISRDRVKKMNIEFDYGQSYFNDVYYNGIHLSSTPNGLILKHPFPFDYLHPSLLIPWNEIDSIKIERGLKPDGKNNLLNKIGAVISPWKYANVKLLRFNKIGIVIPWKSNTRKNAPETLVT